MYGHNVCIGLTLHYVWLWVDTTTLEIIYLKRSSTDYALHIQGTWQPSFLLFFYFYYLLLLHLFPSLFSAFIVIIKCTNETSSPFRITKFADIVRDNLLKTLNFQFYFGAQFFFIFSLCFCYPLNVAQSKEQK